MSRRPDMMGTVMMYGAPSPPEEPDYDPGAGVPVPPTVTLPTVDVPAWLSPPRAKNAHITTTYNAETKTLKLKVTVDGAVMGEVTVIGTNANLTIPL